MSKTEIALVDSHRGYREVLISLFEEIDPDVTICCQADSLQDINSSLCQCSSRIVLLDFDTAFYRDWATFFNLLHKEKQVKFIVLSYYDDHEYFNLLRDSGIHGFILKDKGYPEIKKAIRQVLKGKRYFSPEVIGQTDKKPFFLKQLVKTPISNLYNYFGSRVTYS